MRYAGLNPNDMSAAPGVSFLFYTRVSRTIVKVVIIQRRGILMVEKNLLGIL